MSVALKDLVNSTFAKLAFAVAVSFGAAAKAGAGGLEPGKCYKKQDAELVLKQEGQVPIIIGNRLASAEENRNVNVFFTNAKGYGYNVEGDKPNGVPSSKICVGAAYKNVNLNSLDNPEIPKWGKAIKATDNGIDVQKAYRNGARLILGAQTYTNKADGSEVLGKYIVVGAAVSDRMAGAWSVDLDGNPDTIFDMSDFSVTPHMNRLLAQSTAG